MSVFEKSKSIWVDDSYEGAAIFRAVFTHGGSVKRALCRVECERYYLYINGKVAAWEGGYNGSYDEFDIARLLKKGANSLVCVAFSTPKVGFTLACDALNLYSDGLFAVYADRAYTSANRKNRELDASLQGKIDGAFDPSFSSSLFTAPHVLERSASENIRPINIPRLQDGEKCKGTVTNFGRARTVKFCVPRGFYSPVFTVRADGGENLRLAARACDCADKGLSDSFSYTAANGENRVDIPDVFYADTFFLTLPQGVKLMSFFCRRVEFCPPITLDLSTDDETLNSAFNAAMTDVRCAYTPFTNVAADAYALSVVAREMCYCFSDRRIVRQCAQKLLENFDVAHGFGTSLATLFALGDYGIFNVYHKFEGEYLAVDRVNEFVHYLLYSSRAPQDRTAITASESNGRQEGEYVELAMDEVQDVRAALDKQSADEALCGGFNVDYNLIESALRYNALYCVNRFCPTAALIAAADEELSYLQLFKRADSFSTFVTDDRANAFISLFLDASNVRALQDVRCCAPDTEWAAVEALAVSGNCDIALARFKARLLTHGADFVASALPSLVALFARFDGESIVLSPNYCFDSAECFIDIGGGIGISYKKAAERIDTVCYNHSARTVKFEVKDSDINVTLNKGKSKFVHNTD